MADDLYLAQVRQISDVFNTTTNYIAGDHVIYQGLMYKFITDHSSGAWNTSDVERVTVVSELNSIEDDVSDLKDDFYALGFSVIGGKLNVTYTIQEEE